MLKLPLVVLIATLTLPAVAQTLPSTVSPTSHPVPVGQGALLAERSYDEALLQRQRDQIESLTRQMQALKAQMDALQRQLGTEAEATDSAVQKTNTAVKHGLHLPVGP